MEVWEKREIAWEHEHEVRVFPRNFEFLPNFHKCFYNSIGTGKKCFLFPLLNSLLKTIKNIKLLILINDNTHANLIRPSDLFLGIAMIIRRISEQVTGLKLNC